MPKKTLLVVILFVWMLNVVSQNDSTKNSLHFELSFGQSILFISTSKQASIRKNEALVIPTNAILLFCELRSDKKMRIPVFVNIPTETKQFLVNGQLVNERASTTFGTGLEFRCFQIKLDAKSKLELEIGPLASFIFDSQSQIRVAPIVAGRLRLMRGENFVMYLGGSYSMGIDAFGLLYGTGTVF